MHLIDSVKLGITLPPVLPADLIPSSLPQSPSLTRSDSTVSRERMGSIGGEGSPLHPGTLFIWSSIFYFVSVKF